MSTRLPLPPHTGRRPRWQARMAVAGTSMATIVLALVAAGCGRSAPTGAAETQTGDPDIAGVSVTSLDSVVETVPTPEGETPVATTTPPQQVLYTIQPGDTLSTIAGQYAITVDALAQANGITDVNRISPGQQLIIPVAPPPVDPAGPVDDSALPPP